MPLSNPELDTWKARGVDGFVCMTGRLRGLGGAQDFSGDPNASLAGANYSLQRSLRDSRIVERAKARGMKLYLGVKLANYYNDATPLKEWFDDAGWSREVLPNMRNLAAAAKLSGSPGSPSIRSSTPQQGGDATATWAWDYPGNTHSEAQVRAKARQRGAELMGAILDGFPGAELAVYRRLLSRRLARAGPRGGQRRRPNTSADRAGHRLLGRDDERRRLRGDPLLRLGLLQGPAPRAAGTAPSPTTPTGSSPPSRAASPTGTTPPGASYVSPFGWIDDGPKPSRFDDARSPEHVAEQLLAFRKWGMGGEFANYAYAPLDEFDYSPYVAAMQAGSRPGNVDGVDPTLELTEQPRARRSRAPRTTTSRSAPCAGRTIAADRASPG